MKSPAKKRAAAKLKPRRLSRPSGHHAVSGHRGIPRRLHLVRRHLLEDILAVGSRVRPALVEELGSVEKHLVETFLAQERLGCLEMLLGEGILQQALNGERVAMSPLEKQRASRLGCLKEVIGELLLFG